MLTLTSLWYDKHPLYWCLWPFSLVFQLIVWLRRCWLKRFCQRIFPIPIVVVGNLTVGGVGKTPLVIALASACRQRGLRVGIVSRGYGASISTFPYDVSPDANANEVGDEPLLLSKKTQCPVVISPDRNQAVQYLLENYQPDMIISDDGLQHYAMGRTIEIAVIDGVRGLGNGCYLPAGPLREGRSRLREVDFVIVNGGDITPFLSDNKNTHGMVLTPGSLTKLLSQESVALNDLPQPVAAVAGIGHPQRFFMMLQSLGLVYHEYPFPDHHPFCAADLLVTEPSVVMTEKDAVKCLAFADDKVYFVPVVATLDDTFWNRFWTRLHEK